MSVKVEQGSPLATALQDAIQPKLAETDWDMDDTILAEYIILMLGNEEKTQDQIVAELALLLDKQGDDASVIEFVRWLFEHLQTLGGQSTQGADDANSSAHATFAEAELSTTNDPSGQTSLDADMDDMQTDSAVPTGPKSMRNGNQRTRDRRMLGHMNKALDRTPDASLHRIKGTAGTGRINSHTREPPRGPTPKGPRALANRGAAMQQAMQQGRHMNGPQMGMPQNSPFGAMSPQQQMQMLAMYEENARMMAQFLSPAQQQQMFPAQMGISPAGFQNQNQQPGKSLFERVQDGSPRRNKNVDMSGQDASNVMDPTSSMEVEQSSQTDGKPDPETTVCKFNLHCTKPDCPFVHQSPAAPPGIAIDMTDTCSFGAACKNFKCVGKHPSPAKKSTFAAEVDCKFFPNCTNPSCPFRHPSMPPCRNGADCQVPGCKFSHSKVQCKFNPCLNPACPYKHVDGQKRGKFEDKVWINPDEAAKEEKEHVSDRKFVDDENGEEELLIPGQGKDDAQISEGLVV